MNNTQFERKLFSEVLIVEIFMAHLYQLQNEFTAWKMLADFGIGNVKLGLRLKMLRTTDFILTQKLLLQSLFVT